MLAEEQRQITERLFGLIQADILRVSSEEMPAKLPKRIPRNILHAWAKGENIPPELKAWWIDHIDMYKWCHHDRELGYLVAKLLCVRYKSRLLQGWRVWDEPQYAGGIADLGLIDPKGECIIAVEIGDTHPRKFVEGFFKPKFRQLWHFRYHGLLGGRHYEWERKGVYFVWTRGLRWGEK